MAQEDTRPVFFFDIDNCVSYSLLHPRLLLTIGYSFIRRVSIYGM